QIPDSGTAGRLAMQGAGLASYFVNPMIPAGLGAASIPYLPGVSRAATASILSRPASAKTLADALKRLPPGALGALSGAAQEAAQRIPQTLWAVFLFEPYQRWHNASVENHDADYS